MVSGLVNASEPGRAISLSEARIGEQRDAIILMAEKQWGSNAECHTVRTGVGMARRAFFLETCVLGNVLGNTLYGELPASATYHFLEARLIQVSYEFSQILNPVTFRRCVQSTANELEAKYADTDGIDRRGVTMHGDFLVRLSAVNKVSEIHALRDSLQESAR